jgi:hypothetical protein
MNHVRDYIRMNFVDQHLKGYGIASNPHMYVQMGKHRFA